MSRKQFRTSSVFFCLFKQNFKRKKFSAYNKKFPAFIKETKKARMTEFFTLRVNKTQDRFRLTLVLDRLKQVWLTWNEQWSYPNFRLLILDCLEQCYCFALSKAYCL